MNKALVISTLSIAVLFAGNALAQKSGQSLSVQHGVVIGAKDIKEKSNAGKGAVLGGALGYGVTSSSRSSSSKRKNTAIGAAAGAAAANKAQGDRSAKEYTVETMGGMIAIISDQTQIVVGDCVVVEQGGKTANIRRVDPVMCEPESQEVVAELQDELLEEAEECASAKSELAAAQDDASFDRALRKVEILCNT